MFYKVSKHVQLNKLASSDRFAKNVNYLYMRDHRRVHERNVSSGEWYFNMKVSESDPALSNSITLSKQNRA